MALGSYLWDSLLIQIRTVKHQTETVVNIYSRYLDVHQVTVIPLYKFVSMTKLRQGMLSLPFMFKSHLFLRIFYHDLKKYDFLKLKVITNFRKIIFIICHSLKFYQNLFKPSIQSRTAKDINYNFPFLHRAQ